MTGQHGMGSDSKDASCGDFQISCVIIQRIIILTSNDNLTISPSGYAGVKKEWQSWGDTGEMGSIFMG